MSQSDYLNAKKKMILYNSQSSRSTNNTNISNSTSSSVSINNNRYFSTREEANNANQVLKYETCAKQDNPTIFVNNKICNIKLENNDKTLYALSI